MERKNTMTEGRRMTTKYPKVYVFETSRDACYFFEKDLIRLKEQGVKAVVNHRLPFEITVGQVSTYYMSELTFRKWCKGRTYIKGSNNVLCHSGYPVGKKEREEE